MPHLILAPMERTNLRCVPPAALHLHYFPCVIGRGIEADVRVCDPIVSRRHCRIDWRGGTPMVEDLGSRNGTGINGEPITCPHPLTEGDLLQVGGFIFAVRVDAKPPAGMPRRVLIVEDDANTAETLVVLLRAWGHEVEVARDGDQALAAARVHSPDAVLLDLNLAEGPDARTIAQRLREQPGTHDARMVAVAGELPMGNDGDPTSENFDGVLVKPVGARALRDALATTS